ncbi:MAG: tyrosine-type recombinase/integrase [Blastomonas sp.]
MLAYIDDREAAGVASVDRMRDAWKAMRAYWADLMPESITDDLAKNYSASRRASVATIRTELGILAAALNMGERQGNVTRAPKVWRPQAPERRERHLTKLEFRAFLDACVAPHVRLYAILGVTTAARPSAILDLTWDRVDLEAGMANLNPVGRIQTAKRRPRVPLNELAIEALREAYLARQSIWVIERGGQKVGSIKKGFLAASGRAGFKVTPYTLRHTGAVWMAEAGVPMPEIAQFLGHDDDRTTQRHYSRFSPEYLRKAAGALKW